MKQKLIDWVRRSMRDAVDVDKHFTPTYKPWDQRVCMVPNGDLFKCLRNGSASIITDQIEKFTLSFLEVSLFSVKSERHYSMGFHIRNGEIRVCIS